MPLDWPRADLAVFCFGRRSVLKCSGSDEDESSSGDAAAGCHSGEEAGDRFCEIAFIGMEESPRNAGDSSREDDE